MFRAGYILRNRKGLLFINIGFNPCLCSHYITVNLTRVKSRLSQPPSLRMGQIKPRLACVESKGTIENRMDVKQVLGSRHEFLPSRVALLLYPRLLVSLFQRSLSNHF